MKKKMMFIILVSAVILICLVTFRETSIPKDATFAGGDTFDITICDETGMTTRLILADEKTEEMQNILLDIKMRRTIDEKSTIHHTENPIVIRAVINHKPWTFIFGKENCVYGPGFMSNYKILNAEEIIRKIEKMIEVNYSFYGAHEAFGIVNGSISLNGTEETFDGGSSNVNGDLGSIAGEDVLGIEIDELKETYGLNLKPKIGAARKLYIKLN